VLAVKLYNAGGRFDVTEKMAFHMDTQLFAMPPPGECVLQSTSGLSRTSLKNFANFLCMERETFEELFQLIEPAIGKFGIRPAVCCWFVRLCRSPNSTRPTRPTSWQLVTRKLATRRTIFIWRFLKLI